MKNYTTTTTSSPYIIVDIIMYIATKNLLLCFLHQQGNLKKKKCHHKFNAYFFFLDSHCDIINHTSINDLKDYLKDTALEEEHQFFHIFDNQTRSVVLTWPDHYSNDDTQIDILDDRSLSPKSSCFHCVQRSPRFNTIGQRIDTLLIDYGPFTFILVTMETSPMTTTTPVTITTTTTTPTPLKTTTR
jgi:hypothetical protein